MKKVAIIVFVILGSIAIKAQTGLSAGVALGAPMGDGSDVSTFNLSLNTQYLFEVSESFKIGPAMAYDLWLGKDYEVANVEIEGEDFSFLPIAAALKFNASEKFFLGGDLGYAVGLDDVDGGFYYMPKLGYTSEFFDIYGFYKGISNDGSISAIGAGFMYHF